MTGGTCRRSIKPPRYSLRLPTCTRLLLPTMSDTARHQLILREYRGLWLTCLRRAIDDTVESVRRAASLKSHSETDIAAYDSQISLMRRLCCFRLNRNAMPPLRRTGAPLRYFFDAAIVVSQGRSENEDCRFADSSILLLR